MTVEDKGNLRVHLGNMEKDLSQFIADDFDFEKIQLRVFQTRLSAYQDDTLQSVGKLDILIRATRLMMLILALATHFFV